MADATPAPAVSSRRMNTSYTNAVGIVTDELATENVLGLITYVNKALTALNGAVCTLQDKTLPVRILKPAAADPPHEEYPSHYSEVTVKLKDLEGEVWRFVRWVNDINDELRI